MDQHKEKLADRLRASHAEALAILRGLTDTLAALPTDNPGWTVQDVAAHLATAEAGHQAVIRALLAGQDPAALAQGFDLDRFNEAAVAGRRGDRLADLLAELEANRAETLRLLDQVQPDQWDLAGRHPGGFDTTVEGTFRVIAIHEKRHLRDIRAALAQ